MASWKVVALGVPGVVLAVVAGMALGSPTPSSRREACVPEGAVGVVAAAGDVWTVPLGSAYQVTAEYGWRTHPVRGGRDLHSGIDLATGGGAAVLAASGGTVVGVTDLGGRSYGLYVDVEHAGGVRTRYAHLASARVRVGQQVQAGEQIGVEGASGGVTGPHLHFEVIVGGSPVEPREAVRARGLSFDGRPGALVGGGRARGDGLPAAESGSRAGAEDAPAGAQGVDRSGSLSPEQMAAARVVVETGHRLGLPRRAWVVALATALQESTLGADASSMRLNGDGDVGLFQQRAYPGWYADGATTEENVARLLDAEYAARTFYLGHDVAVRASGGAGPVGYHIPGLVDVAGWESMPVWQAAAKVQRPAAQFEVYYAKHEATAVGILARLDLGDLGGQPTGCTPAPGASSSGGPVGGSGGGSWAVQAALGQVGQPYAWGGGSLTGVSAGVCCSPTGQDGRLVQGFDCSGLTRYAWAQAGVVLPRTSEEQQRAVRSVPVDQIQAGDLLFFPGHVGLADGQGGMVHAPRPGKAVEVLPGVLSDPYYGPRFQGAGRP